MSSRPNTPKPNTPKSNTPTQPDISTQPDTTQPSTPPDPDVAPPPVAAKGDAALQSYLARKRKERNERHGIPPKLPPSSSVTDADVDRILKYVDGPYNKLDEYPALSSHVLAAREKTDAVRRAKQMQGESKLPVSALAHADGTADIDALTIPGMEDEEVPMMMALLKLKPIQEAILINHLRGLSLREIGAQEDVVALNKGRVVKFQNVRHILNNVKGNMLEMLINDEGHGCTRVFLNAVNRPVPRPKSGWVRPSTCECPYYPPRRYMKKKILRQPQQEWDEYGNQLIIEIPYSVDTFQCVHCSKERNREEWNALCCEYARKKQEETAE